MNLHKWPLSEEIATFCRNYAFLLLLVSAEISKTLSGPFSTKILCRKQKERPFRRSLQKQLFFNGYQIFHDEQEERNLKLSQEPNSSPQQKSFDVVVEGPSTSEAWEFCTFLFDIQSGAAYCSLGFEDESLGSSPGWWAATVVSYCPSRPVGTTQILIFKALRKIGRLTLYVLCT